MDTSDDRADLLRRIEKLEASLQGGLEVEKLVVRSKSGRPVIEMAATPSGEPEIVLFDARGQERVLLRLADDECALDMLDGQGGTRVRIAAADATSRVVLWPVPGGDRRAEIRVASDGTALFAVTEAGTPMRASLGIDASGNSVLGVQPPRAGGASEAQS